MKCPGASARGAAWLAQTAANDSAKPTRRGGVAATASLLLAYTTKIQEAASESISGSGKPSAPVKVAPFLRGFVHLLLPVSFSILPTSIFIENPPFV